MNESNETIFKVANGSRQALFTEAGEKVAYRPAGPTTSFASVDQAGSPHIVRVWRAEDGKEVRCLLGHKNKATCAAICPDGKAVCSGRNDRTIRLWPGVG